jgi:alanyl-tRNA synthetase
VDWFEPVIKQIISDYQKQYPELDTNRDKIFATITEEAMKFGQSLERGFRELQKIGEEGDISGEDAYYLHETFGLPFIVIADFIRGAGGLNVDIDELKEKYEEAAKSHKEVSRAGAEGKFGGHGLITATGEIVAGDEEQRKRILRMHTSTHLLHQALRDVFGDTVRQMGSDINVERLRFDFSHQAKMTSEEISKVESTVNEKIKTGLPVYRKEMTKHEAEKTGALAFFKDKYGGTVSVYFIGSEDPLKAYSKEFCGGPHVTNTKEIGHFKILKEEAVGSGVRRIKATIE